MSGPKITVVGAGSFFFGRPIIHKAATSPIMAGGTLALVDTDPKTLATMMKLAKRILAESKSGVTVIGSTDRKEVMKGSHFVVLTFSDRNAHFRGIDTAVAAKHGIRMCSSDTIGPGGIFRALREIPHALAVAKDAQRLCPEAWVINFINPTAVLGIALMRYAPQMRSFALCDGLHEPYHTLRLCKCVGLLPENATSVSAEMMSKLEMKVGGVNHVTWLTSFKFEGKDLMPRVRRWLVSEMNKEAKTPCPFAKGRHNWDYALQLFDLYGAYPMVISHTKEYVPFWQGYGVLPNKPEPVKLFEADQRAQFMADAWKVTEEYASGKRTVKEFIKKIHNDHATDIIESMWGGLNKPFFINTANRGAVTNMAPDAFLELRSDVDMRGPRPQPFGPLPRGILGLTQLVLDTHELTAEAAVTGDRTILRRAMLTDPIVNNIADADACIAELLETEKDALPSYWYRRK